MTTPQIGHRREAKSANPGHGIATIVLPAIRQSAHVTLPGCIREIVLSKTAELSALCEALESNRSRMALVYSVPGAESSGRVSPICVISSIEILDAGGLGQSRHTGPEGYLTESADPSVRIRVTGLIRARIVEMIERTPHPTVVAEIVETNDESLAVSSDSGATVRVTRESLSRLADLEEQEIPQLVELAADYQGRPRQVDVLAGRIGLGYRGKIAILEALSPASRAEALLAALSRRLQAIESNTAAPARQSTAVDSAVERAMPEAPDNETRSDPGSDLKRESILREYGARVDAAALSAEASRQARRHLDCLSWCVLHSNDFSEAMTRLDLLCALPWTRDAISEVSLATVRRLLDVSHVGLGHAKDRLMEQLIVSRRMDGRSSGPVLTLVGPPGVGKASLAMAYGRALGRPTYRIEVGGLSGAAEIRGTRGPRSDGGVGRIAGILLSSGVRNPVLVLDGIDRPGVVPNAELEAALLEVLDSDRNRSFTDRYVGVPFDLSRVSLICTANSVASVYPSLAERLDSVEIDSLTEKQKLHIAAEHLIPDRARGFGLSPEDFAVSASACVRLIRDYTRECGVAQLDRLIGALCRTAVRRIDEEGRSRIVVDVDDLSSAIGPAKYPDCGLPPMDPVGVAAGIAITSTGGEILMIETTLFPGQPELVLTGQLGDVMRESAVVALTWVRANAQLLGIQQHHFSSTSVVVHVPSGSVPKDGPSAGVAIAVSLVSAFTGRRVRRDLALTGEVTTRGHILPVGSLAEKMLTACRFGMRAIAVPDRNSQDVLAALAESDASIQVFQVSHLTQVLELALLPPE